MVKKENGVKRVVVIGLGIFGSNLVRTLYDNGVEVIAIDKDKDAVHQVRDCCSKSIVGDGTNKELLDSIGIQPEDVAVVSFGEDLAASTLITLHLKELGVKKIIVKAPGEDHKRVLERVGASEVIIPEKEMADKVARNLITPNVLDYIPLSGEYTISELVPPASFWGKTIGELHLRTKYHIEVIAVKEALTDKLRMVPRADFVIKDTDVLVVIGKQEDMEKIK